jgi:hypothetical protein
MRPHRARLLWVFLPACFAIAAPAAVAADPLAEARGACQAALAAELSGSKTYTSRGPCHQAAKLSGLPEDMRHEVQALMSPAANPSLDDLGIALMLVEAAVNKAADQPWGHLARCDVARRLGNAAALKTCLTDLATMARKHPLSQQATATTHDSASTAVWVGRIALLLLLIATAAHAGHRWFRRRARRGAAVLRTTGSTVSSAAAIVAAFVVLSALSAGAARAEEDGIPLKRDQLSDFLIDDDNPERSVPDVETQNRKPLQFAYFIQDLGGKADRARKRGDHGAATRYYKALTAAVPQSAYGPRQMCLSAEDAGDLPTAIVACRTAITRDDATLGDYERFVAVALRKTPLAPLERKEVEAVIAHVESQSPGTAPNRLRCELGIRVSDQKLLETCTTALTKLAADDPQTVSYQWALAMLVHDQSEATALIARAKQLGMGPDGVAQMERATSEMSARRLVRMAVMGVTAVLAVLAFLGLRSWNRRRMPVPARAA